MSEKKYQVFISSTYSDLIEERRKIMDILLTADCIPAGMEAFVATDNEQFEVIKKVIDLCDYYILIVGKRYGSINPNTGISYTEMEYEYAKQEGIPILAFVINDSAKLVPAKYDIDEDKIKRLESFRDKVMNNRIVSIWNDIGELAGLVAIAIMKAKKEIVRPGWQRGVEYDEASLRRVIMDLEQKNIKINEELGKANKEIKDYIAQDNLAFDETDIEIKYHYYKNKNKLEKSAKLKLTTIFSAISIDMLEIAISEFRITNIVNKLVSKQSIYFDDELLIKKLLNQYRALGLINSIYSEKRKTNYWKLTPRGKKIRDEMNLIRKQEIDEQPVLTNPK